MSAGGRRDPPALHVLVFPLTLTFGPLPRRLLPVMINIIIFIIIIIIIIVIITIIITIFFVFVRFHTLHYFLQLQQETTRLVARSDVPSPSGDFFAELPPGAWYCLPLADVARLTPVEREGGRRAMPAD